MSLRHVNRAVRFTIGLFIAAVAVTAQAQGSPDAANWLDRIYRATRDLSYSGTFVYQQGDTSETSRIARRAVDGVTVERLEVLDGVPREVVRTGGSVRCYLPEARTVKLDSGAERRAFPALLPDHATALSAHYRISVRGVSRIAGYTCREIVLEPKDSLRYGYHLWADEATGMLLKARTVDDSGRTVEKFYFTQLAIGSVSEEQVRPKHVTDDWRVEDAAVKPVDVAQSGWTISADVPGFRKVVEVRRLLREARPVNQVVFSDGLAAVSVFIEPRAAAGAEVRSGLASMGAINIVTRELAEHVVTVVGEAPAASVQRIASGVHFRPSR